MAYRYTLSTVIPAAPDVIYDAWLDSRRHSAMTGGAARMSGEPGAPVSAWDGYIVGANVELVPVQRIVQTWRTSEFPAADADSIITLTLQAVPDGTRLTLEHRNVPDGQTSYEQGGWEQFYFEPMRRYFSRLARLRSASKGSAAKAAVNTARDKARRRVRRELRSRL